MPNFKKVCFTLTSVIFVPILFFALLEYGLKATGVGQSYNLFNTVKIKGQHYYQDNPHFADQFYPSSFKISPVATTFTKLHSPDLIRVYILGGSAALGFPYRNHDISRHLTAQLSQALPNKKIEIINTAMTAINSHVVYEAAKFIPAHPGDFALILMGNNEVIGPYGPGTIYKSMASNIHVIRTIQALKRTRTWQILELGFQALRSTDNKMALKWQGMQMFSKNGIRHDDNRLEAVYQNYQTNLNDIITMLNNKGIHVILSTVPVNLRNNAPFLSMHSSKLNQHQLADWNVINQKARSAFIQKDWSTAIDNYRALIAIDDDYADSHFQLGRAYEKSGLLQQSKKHYQKALDLDGLHFRTNTRLNHIIKKTAYRFNSDKLSFIDSTANFEQASAPFQPGWNLFLEHVHYGFDGNYLIAKSSAKAILKKIQPLTKPLLLQKQEIAKQIAFPNDEVIAEIKNILDMIKQPPFIGQSNYETLKHFLEKKLARVIVEVGSPTEVVQRRMPLIISGKADWKIFFELAILNRYLGNKTAMYDHLKNLFKRYPHNHESYMIMATELSKEQRWEEAIDYLQASLNYTRGDKKKIAVTYTWLGTAYLRLGNYTKAKFYLEVIFKEFSDNIDLNLKAYANLIKYSHEHNLTKENAIYFQRLQAYYATLKKSGRDKNYRMLKKRMAMIKTWVSTNYG